REDQRIRQRDAAERGAQARVVVAEDGEPIERQGAQRGLSDLDRDALGESSEEAMVDGAVGEVGGAHAGPEHTRPTTRRAGDGARARCYAGGAMSEGATTQPRRDAGGR